MSNIGSSSSELTPAETKILVVDDEKVIRSTLAQSLETLGYDVKTAINGEDALKCLQDSAQESSFDLMLCDLKMPGMDGMALIERVAQAFPNIQIIMISAHGTVTNAVEAMKLGAVDFIQKPFTPQEIRDLVQKVLARPHLVPDRPETETPQLDYETQLEAAKYKVCQREYDQAIAETKQAIGTDPSRPEAFNLLGELLELIGDRLAALKNYRVALDLDPVYAPAKDNLHRATTDPQNRPTV